MASSLGLLTPRSGLYPTIGFDLQAGIQAGLENSEAATSVVIENIGFAEKEALIYGTCEKLLLQGTKIIAAYMNPAMASYLQPLFEAAGGLLVVLDSGYHFPTHEGRLPNVVFLSLEGALCCRMAAAAAVEEVPDDVLAFTASYYDAGYRAPYVVTRAVEEAGRRIDFHHITALRRAEFSLEALSAWIQNTAKATVVAAFCGDMSADFLEHLSRFEKKPAALYAGPYMAEPTWLEQSTYPGMDFKAYVPWAPELNLPANERFASLLNSRKPTIFSLLGYEAGRLAGLVLTSGLSGAAAALAMTEHPLDSPRGCVRIDPATFQSQAPVYEVTIGRDEETWRCRVTEPARALTNTEDQRASLRKDIASMRGMPSTSWLNAYPCIA